MVFLSRIYTKSGDQGETGLGDGTRVPKDHPRVVAYGRVDELNAVLGLVLAHDPAGAFRACPQLQPELAPHVSHLQQAPLRTRVKWLQVGHGSPS